ncbi:MAG: hypothetical protein NZ846_10720 [Thermus sp.]|uniref:hypothetical protein n=1 Tax=Thermus sp. TaxID=275 RepID=UPI0025FACCD0|nr:hypothetical protein [Thermus sp.]MCS6868795.1 hypothetical protein [Thermus sp.]MCS7219420.1 hypothetical protein [Thermus sp.]MCX7850705.1 hypothetical protein [Thermus sp.]MDW8016525.1 hypothetical protein [Thermus sp.]MDW8357528.1 hypothetical protein [Thermus sp.]
MFERPVLHGLPEGLGPAPFPQQDPFWVLAESLPAEAPDPEGVRGLKRARGMGPWRGRMPWAFGLGWPEVWPVDDLGAKRAAWAPLGVGKAGPFAPGEAFPPYRSHLWASRV